MSDKLKSCPFCGGKVDPKGWLDKEGNRGPECEGCGAAIDTVELWNTRVQPKKVTLEEAEEKCEKHNYWNWDYGQGYIQALKDFNLLEHKEC